MSYELTGKLVAKYDTVQRTETFKTREFAVEKTHPQATHKTTTYQWVDYTRKRDKSFL